jgi:uncharacterized membrane protein YedE/YeeE
MEWLSSTRWSPYAVGIGIGILSWFTFLISSKPIGCSTAFARSSGMLEKMVRGAKVDLKPYYQEFKPAIDWEWMLVLGIVMGSAVSALTSGDFTWQWIPARWAAAFGTGVSARLAVAVGGGILLGFGARWAGGCTSGHGISGTLQLTLGSWVAAICFFAGGIPVAYLIYRVLGS